MAAIIGTLFFQYGFNCFILERVDTVRDLLIILVYPCPFLCYKNSITKKSFLCCHSCCMSMKCKTLRGFGFILFHSSVRPPNIFPKGPNLGRVLVLSDITTCSVPLCAQQGSIRPYRPPSIFFFFFTHINTQCTTAVCSDINFILQQVFFSPHRHVQTGTRDNITDNEHVCVLHRFKG